MDAFLNQINDVIIDVKSPNKTLDPLKKMLQMPVKQLFASDDVKFENLGYLLKIIPYQKNDTKIEYIDNAIEIFDIENPNIFNKNDIENLREELHKIPFGKFHVILHSYQNSKKYFYIGVYCILHFIKNTKYILKHLKDKERYHHSRFKKDVLENYINILNKIKSKMFFQSQSEFNIKQINKKETILKLIDENYSTLIGYAHFIHTFGVKGMIIDSSIEKIFTEVIDLLNSILVTETEVIKSLSVLLFFMLDKQMLPMEVELSIENIIRIFFEKEILVLKDQDTFSVNTKELRGKNVYIHSTFDAIPIYGVNRYNKYFFYRKLNAKDIMIIQYKAYKMLNIEMPLSVYRYIRNIYKNSYQYNYQGIFPEFFTNKNINPASVSSTFFSEAKNYAPDEFLQKL